MSPRARLLHAVALVLTSSLACVYVPMEFPGGLGAGDVRATVRVDRGSGEEAAVGARVSIVPGTRRTTTSGGGVFTLRNLPAGPTRLLVTLDEGAGGRPLYGLQVSVNIPERNGRRGAVDLGVLRLGRTSTVRGKVRSAVNGACAPGVVPAESGHVVLDLEDHATSWTADGDFVLEGVVAGAHDAAAAGATTASELVTFTLGAGQQFTLEQPLCLSPAAPEAALNVSLETPPDEPDPPLPAVVNGALRALPSGQVLPFTGSPAGLTVTALQPSIYALEIPLEDAFLPVRAAWLVVPRMGRAVRLVAWHDDGESPVSSSSSSSVSSSSSASSASSASSSGASASASASGVSVASSTVSPGSLPPSSSSNMGASAVGPTPVRVFQVFRGYSGGAYVAPGETRAWAGWVVSADGDLDVTAVNVSAPAVTGVLRLYKDAQLPAPGEPEALQPADTLLATAPLDGSARTLSLAINETLTTASPNLALLATLQLDDVPAAVPSCHLAPVTRAVEGTSPQGRTVEFPGGGFSTGESLTCVPRYLEVAAERVWVPHAAEPFANFPFMALVTRVHGPGVANLLALSVAWSDLSNAQPTTVRVVVDENLDWRVSGWEPVAMEQAWSAGGNMLTGNAPLQGEQRLLLTLDVPEVMGFLSYRPSVRVPSMAADVPVVGTLQFPSDQVVNNALGGLTNLFIDVVSNAASTGTPIDGAVADVDGNGFPDVILLMADGEVRWLQNAKGNLLDAPTALFTSTASGLRAIHAVDLDGDAQLDVVVVHAAGVDVHRGQGTGVFAVPSTVMFRDPVQGRRTVLLADVVADGRLDVVTAGVSGVSVHANVGGILQPPMAAVPHANADAVTELHAADLDRDGRADVLVRVNDTVLLLRNTGSGWEAPRAFPLTMPGVSLGGVLAVDVDRDGFLEVVAPGQASVETLGRSTGPTDLVSRQRLNVTASAEDMLAVDLRQDDLVADLLMVNGAGYAVLSGTSMGTFQLGGGGGSGPQAARRLLPGDFNRDGQPEVLLLSTATPPLRLLMPSGRRRTGVQDGAGVGFAAAVPLMGTTLDGTVMDHGDFNRDGWEDVVFADGAGSLVVGLHTRNMGTPEFTFSTTPFQVHAAHLAVTDWNGDAIPDVVLCRVTGLGTTLLEVFAADDTGALDPTPLATWSIGTDELPLGMAVGDFTGDGAPDLVFSHLTNPGTDVVTWIINGEPPGTVHSASVARNVQDLVLEDVDGPMGAPDGVPEVVALMRLPDRVEIFPMTNPPLGSSTTVMLDTPGALVRAGRLDRDARTDLLVLHTDGTMTTLSRGPTGWSTTPATGVSLALEPQGAILADMDGDSDLDVVTSSAVGGGFVEALTNRNPTRMGSLVSGTVPDGTLWTDAGARAATVADFDRDGDLDVMVAVTGGLRFLRGN